MTLTKIEYVQGSDLPDLAIVWEDADGSLIGFETDPHTFNLELIAIKDGAQALDKDAGITGADTSPNVTIAWAAVGDLNDVPVGSYLATLTATRTGDQKDRKMQFILQVKP